MKYNNHQQIQILIDRVAHWLHILRSTVNDILLYQNYKCSISKNNKRMHGLISDNDNEIYINSRKVWYETSQLTQLINSDYYYLIVYIILAIFMTMKCLYRKTHYR